MRIDILTNAIDVGDAVSAHCLLLRRYCEELGRQARLLAGHVHPSLAGQVEDPSVLMEPALPGDVLLHQLFHESGLLHWADSYRGRRVLMYHNITPPEFAGANLEVRRACERGLAQLRSSAGIYDCAAGMSEFSRADLASAGHAPTRVFPLLVDLERFGAPPPRRAGALGREGARLLFVGRLAPNKRHDQLIRLLAAYRDLDPAATLTLVGDLAQHPAWVELLFRLARSLGLEPGRDVLFPGKVPEEELCACFRAADAFVCLSRHEGFGAPLIEAMAFDLPVFALPVAAVEETLGGAGHLLAADDPAAAAAEIHGVLSDPRALDALRLARAARLRAFSSDAQRARVAVLLDEIEQLPPPCRPRPRVSVVINTYNRAWWLDRCLRELARQSYRDFEVVVVNGPSSDDTSEVLARHRDGITIVRTASHVLSVSRNLGIAAAAGDLIAFIDDDAVPDPRWLENLAGAFHDPEVAAAGGWVYRMNGRDVEFANGVIDRQGFVEWNRAAPGRCRTWTEGRLNTVSGNNCIFRRAALEQIGGFDERIEYYHDEADVVMRLAAAGYHVVHRPHAVVFHEAARSSNRASRYSLNWYAVVKNTLYCALKNYTGARRARFALGVARRVARERMRPILAWRRQGEIGARQCARQLRGCAAGIAVGCVRGLLRSARFASLPPAPPERFRPYPARPMPLSVALLSQALPAAHPGGIATYTWNLARGLAALGCGVHLISADAPAEPEYLDGVWLHRPHAATSAEDLPLPPSSPISGRNVAYSLAVHATLRDIESRFPLDVIESPNWDAEGLVAALDGRWPVVVRAHSPLTQVMAVQGWAPTGDLRFACGLEERLFRHAAVVTGSTRAILGLIGEHYGVPEEKMRRLPLGIECEESAGRRQWDGPPTVLFVGRLERRKGIHVLLEAIERLSREGLRARFLLAGADEPEPGRAWASWWRLRHPGGAGAMEVAFLGPVDEGVLGSLYETCDLFVAPSLYESFGLVFLEAMARGKPVIGTCAGGIPEVVEDGVTGLLVEPGDADALASCLRRLLADAVLRRRLGENGRRRFREIFSRDVMTRRTLSLYQEVARAWNGRLETLYHARGPEFLRTPDTRVVPVPGSSTLAVQYDGAGFRTFVYGPYMTLPAGGFRAQFKLLFDATLPAATPLARVDVFSAAQAWSVEKTIQAEDVLPGGGCLVDLFFDLPAEAGGFEFRVHSLGVCPVSIREILVTRWPVAPPRPPAGETHPDSIPSELIPT
jgi:glycosyltransferase involved in cell wall biosynthesis/GT2 family glycosyltransferase